MREIPGFVYNDKKGKYFKVNEREQLVSSHRSKRILEEKQKEKKCEPVKNVAKKENCNEIISKSVPIGLLELPVASCVDGKEGFLFDYQQDSSINQIFLYSRDLKNLLSYSIGEEKRKLFAQKLLAFPTDSSVTLPHEIKRTLFESVNQDELQSMHQIDRSDLCLITSYERFWLYQTNRSDIIASLQLPQLSSYIVNRNEHEGKISCYFGYKDGVFLLQDLSHFTQSQARSLSKFTLPLKSPSFIQRSVNDQNLLIVCQRGGCVKLIDLRLKQLFSFPTLPANCSISTLWTENKEDGLINNLILLRDERKIIYSTSRDSVKIQFVLIIRLFSLVVHEGFEI